MMVEETVEREWNYLLFRDGVEGPDAARELMTEEKEEMEVDFPLPSVQGRCRVV